MAKYKVIEDAFTGLHRIEVKEGFFRPWRPLKNALGLDQAKEYIQKHKNGELVENVVYEE